jgi:hypothetical protein
MQAFAHFVGIGGPFCHESSAGKRNPRFKVQSLRRRDGSLNSQEMPAEATMCMKNKELRRNSENLPEIVCY